MRSVTYEKGVHPDVAHKDLFGDQGSSSESIYANSFDNEGAVQQVLTNLSYFEPKLTVLAENGFDTSAVEGMIFDLKNRISTISPIIEENILFVGFTGEVEQPLDGVSDILSDYENVAREFMSVIMSKQACSIFFWNRKRLAELIEKSKEELGIHH